MPHVHRFHIEGLPTEQEEAILTGQEAHHALHVARVRTGDAVQLFDGMGHEWDALVLETARREVRVRLDELRTTMRPGERLTLFQAWLHRDKAVEELVRHGTEIGIARFVFFPSHHSERAPHAGGKWKRTAIEACKQCRRAWLPDFAIAESLEDALTQASGMLLVATRELPAVALRDALTAHEVSLFVGPEGDFTEQELGAFVAREAKAISLGSTTYRSEVAAILAAALIQYELGQLGPS